MGIVALAADARGQVRAQCLLLVGLGTYDCPLLWQPTAVSACIPATSTRALCAQKFARYLIQDQWAQYRTNPRRALHTAIHFIQTWIVMLMWTFGISGV